MFAELCTIQMGGTHVWVCVQWADLGDLLWVCAVGRFARCTDKWCGFTGQCSVIHWIYVLSAVLDLLMTYLILVQVSSMPQEGLWGLIMLFVYQETVF